MRDKGGADVQRKGGDELPALIDPLVLARQGEDILPARIVQAR